MKRRCGVTSMEFNTATLYPLHTPILHKTTCQAHISHSSLVKHFNFRMQFATAVEVGGLFLSQWLKMSGMWQSDKDCPFTKSSDIHEDSILMPEIALGGLLAGTNLLCYNFVIFAFADVSGALWMGFFTLIACAIHSYSFI